MTNSNKALEEISVENDSLQELFKIRFSHFLTRTDKEYCKENLSFLVDRGIENRLLENLVEHLPDGAIIAGGFILNVINEEKNATDIDFFFTSKEAFNNTLDLFLNRSEEDEKDIWAYGGYSPKLGEDGKPITNERYISLVHPTRPAIQLIKMVWYEDAKHVIDSFDFTITQCAVDNKGFYFNSATLMDLARKRLVLHRLQYAASTLRRLIKYSKKGYYACPGSLVTIAEAIQKFNGPMDANQVVYLD